LHTLRGHRCITQNRVRAVALRVLCSGVVVIIRVAVSHAAGARVRSRVLHNTAGKGEGGATACVVAVDVGIAVGKSRGHLWRIYRSRIPHIDLHAVVTATGFIGKTIALPRTSRGYCVTRSYTIATGALVMILKARIWEPGSGAVVDAGICRHGLRIGGVSILVVASSVGDGIFSEGVEGFPVCVGVAVLITPTGGQVVDALDGAVLAGFNDVASLKVVIGTTFDDWVEIKVECLHLSFDVRKTRINIRQALSARVELIGTQWWRFTHDGQDRSKEEKPMRLHDENVKEWMQRILRKE
jgi:hypothetical protein